MSQSLDGTKTAVALPHCIESTKESIAGWSIFGSEVWLEFWQNDGMWYKKITQVRGASSRKFVDGSTRVCLVQADLPSVGSLNSSYLSALNSHPQTRLYR